MRFGRKAPGRLGVQFKLHLQKLIGGQSLGKPGCRDNLKDVFLRVRLNEGGFDRTACKAIAPLHAAGETEGLKLTAHRIEIWSKGKIDDF